MGDHLPHPPTLATEEEGQERTTMSTPDAILDVLTEAGFTAVSVHRHQDNALLGKTAEEAVDFIFGWGPVRHWFRDTDIDTELQAREAVHTALLPYEQAGGVRQPGSGLVVTAIRP